MCSELPNVPYKYHGQVPEGSTIQTGNCVQAPGQEVAKTSSDDDYAFSTCLDQDQNMKYMKQRKCKNNLTVMKESGNCYVGRSRGNVLLEIMALLLDGFQNTLRA